MLASDNLHSIAIPIAQIESDQEIEVNQYDKMDQNSIKFVELELHVSVDENPSYTNYYLGVIQILGLVFVTILYLSKFTEAN